MKALKPTPLVLGMTLAVFAGLCGWLYVRSNDTPEPVATEDSQPVLPLQYAVVSVQIGGRPYRLDVADTPQKKSLGLGERDRLGADTGMLFTYHDAAEPKCFWMKDMRFAIDIIWLDSQSRVSYIEHALGPETYPQTFCPDGGGQYVIELPAGAAAKEGLKIGDKLDISI